MVNRHAAEQSPIFLLARTGWIIRDILLGEFTPTVTAERPLVVAVPEQSRAKLDALAQEPSITLVDYPYVPYVPPHNFREHTLTWNHIMARVQQGHKDTASMRLTAGVTDWDKSRRHRAIFNMLVGAGRVIKALNLSEWIEGRYLDHVAAQPITQRWRDLFAAQRPAAVISTLLTLTLIQEPSADLPAVVAAHSMGIPVGTLIQSWDNLSSKPTVLPSWVDAYWTWSPFMSAELRRFYPRISVEHITTVGSPHFDFHRLSDMIEPREQFMARWQLDPAKPYVLIGTSTNHVQPDAPQVTIELVRLIRQQHPDLQILLRWHPKETSDRWQPFVDELRDHGVRLQDTRPDIHMDSGGFVPPRDFHRDQVNTIYHSAVVVQMTSTLTVDAAILDRPVISIGYDALPDRRFTVGNALTFTTSTHYNYLVETGGVTVAWTPQACLDAIQAYLADPTLHAAGRQHIVEIVTGDLLGEAGKNLAAAALKLAEKGVVSR